MKKKATKGTIAFRIIYGILSGMLIIVIGFALYYLWHALGAYEKSQPEIAAKELIAEINRDKKSFLSKIDVKLNDFEDISDANEYFNSITKGKITYIRNGKESSEDKTVYNIKSENNIIAKVTVEPSDIELGYGFYKYAAGEICFGEVPTSSYSATVPSNAVLYCNGKEVSSKYVSETGTVYENTKNFLGYAENLPYNITYSIDGFINEPVFTAKDMLGNELKQENGKFVPAQVKNDELTQLALDYLTAYSKFIEGDGYLSTATSYLIPDTLLYNNLLNYQNRYHNYHTSYDFLDVDAEDPVFYNENAVTVRISYDHVLYGVQSTENGEHHALADYTVYIVKVNGQWKISEMILNG